MHSRYVDPHRRTLSALSPSHVTRRPTAGGRANLLGTESSPAPHDCSEIRRRAAAARRLLCEGPGFGWKRREPLRTLMPSVEAIGVAPLARRWLVRYADQRARRMLGLGCSSSATMADDDGHRQPARRGAGRGGEAGEGTGGADGSSPRRRVVLVVTSRRTGGNGGDRGYRLRDPDALLPRLRQRRLLDRGGGADAVLQGALRPIRPVSAAPGSKRRRATATTPIRRCTPARLRSRASPTRWSASTTTAVVRAEPEGTQLSVCFSDLFTCYTGGRGMVFGGAGMRGNGRVGRLLAAASVGIRSRRCACKAAAERGQKILGAPRRARQSE